MTLDPQQLSHHYRITGELDSATIDRFRQAIYSRYHANPRPMPWRETRDPYRILVSEIMLQQTQVERVKTKYAEFLACFPDISRLAAASLPDVLAVWQGLGYNRRAITLKRCAEVAVERYDGKLPATVAELESLPGIGPYTARAVAAFAFGVAEPLIETNIRTLFIHCFFHDRDDVHDRELLPLVSATLDRDNPREWYYALMDYGVAIKQQHPNPGRRSRHHTRQSRFEGSNRQLRSRLLREIMAHGELDAGTLTDLTGANGEQVFSNLLDLEREGFLEKQPGGWRVRQK